MKFSVVRMLIVALSIALLPAVLAAGGEDVTMKGEIVDVACYVSHGDHGVGPDHADCAKRCVKAGQPMGLLTEDGDLYLLFADHSDSSAFDKAKDHAGEMVTVTGKMAENAGVKGITVHGVDTA